jgi:hypothetical protein
MALTKVTGKGITDSALTEDKLGPASVTNTKIGTDAVTSAKIQDGQVTADDLASTLDLSSKTVTLPSSATAQIDQNIALLGFKMAVNDGLTVFNLVDGVVDEFNDESGTDEAEGTNDYYCGTGDWYTNNCSPVSVAAGFGVNTITEPDTSTAGTNPANGSGTPGVFTVPTGVSQVSIYAWGAGGGGGYPFQSPDGYHNGGAGGYATGNFPVTPGQTLSIIAGEGGGTSGGFGGSNPNDGEPVGTKRGGGNKGADSGGSGGGLAYVGTDTLDSSNQPRAIIVAGGGGGGGYQAGAPGTAQTRACGGGGGGNIGYAGGFVPFTATTSNGGPTGTPSGHAGGGSTPQGAGGQAGSAPGGTGQSGGVFYGGDGGGSPSRFGGGGAGFYGGGGGGRQSAPETYGAGGGGSSYVGHPQVTCGSTTAAPNCQATITSPGGSGSPVYPQTVAQGWDGVTPAPAAPIAAVGLGANVNDTNVSNTAFDGYVLITATGTQLAQPGGGSTTIVSDTFSSTSVPTSSRIVVFEEDVDSPTLNTDIIASISRDGTNFTNATLTDSGYVTGSSGQRILTGQADISGQPSGQSMRWKLALANNTVKIHGVALQWS